jgi:hypothetical protein
MSERVVNPPPTALDLRHLRRQIRSALELAVVGLAPSDLLDRLAASAGLLETLAELPAEAPAVSALIPGVADRARAALGQWDAWQSKHLGKGLA